MRYFYEDGTWGTLLCNISLLYWLVKYRFHLVRQLTNLDRASWGTNCICMCGSGVARPEAWALTSPHLAYFYMVVFVGNKPARPGVYVPFEDWSFSVSHKRILYSDSSPSLCTLCSVQPEKNRSVSFKEVIGSHQFAKDFELALFSVTLWLRDQNSAVTICSERKSRLCFSFHSEKDTICREAKLIIARFTNAAPVKFI